MHILRVYDYTEWSSAMPTARIFTNGNSQSVRLPKEFRFNEAEVVIKKVGDRYLLDTTICIHLINRRPGYEAEVNRNFTFQISCPI